MNKKFHYTEKYNREQLEKENPDLYVEKSKINRKKLILIVFATLVLLSVIAISNYKNESYLKNNGIQAKAKITSIISEHRRLNDIELTRVQTYYIKYEFLYKSKLVSGISIIHKEKINDYFDKIPKVNDSIEIIYEASKAEFSWIKRK